MRAARRGAATAPPKIREDEAIAFSMHASPAPLSHPRDLRVVHNPHLRHLRITPTRISPPP
jgi:hypothetical protein